MLVLGVGENYLNHKIKAFDNLIGTGNIEALKLAVAGIKAQYDNCQWITKS